MKRSKSLSLLLMGSVALGVTACDSREEVSESMNVYSSVDECVSSGEFNISECTSFFREAEEQAPKFSSLSDCENQFGEGACQQSTTVQGGTGSMWMPLMMGFMAGHFLSSGRMMAGSQGLYGNPASTGPANTGNRTFRTANGGAVTSAPGGRVTGVTPQVMQSMQHNARPAIGRSGSGSRGGFSGGSAYGGASS